VDWVDTSAPLLPEIVPQANAILVIFTGGDRVFSLTLQSLPLFFNFRVSVLKQITGADGFFAKYGK